MKLYKFEPSPDDGSSLYDLTWLVLITATSMEEAVKVLLDSIDNRTDKINSDRFYLSEGTRTVEVTEITSQVIHSEGPM